MINGVSKYTAIIPGKTIFKTVFPYRLKSQATRPARKMATVAASMGCNTYITARIASRIINLFLSEANNIRKNGRIIVYSTVALSMG